MKTSYTVLLCICTYLCSESQKQNEIYYCHNVQIFNRNDSVNLEIMVSSNIAHTNSFCLISHLLAFIGLSPLL